MIEKRAINMGPRDSWRRKEVEGSEDERQGEGEKEERKREEERTGKHRRHEGDEERSRQEQRQMECDFTYIPRHTQRFQSRVGEFISFLFKAGKQEIERTRVPVMVSERVHQTNGPASHLQPPFLPAARGWLR